MITPITQPQRTIRSPSGTLYVLVMDTHGKPLALAPLQQLRHNPFPLERIRLMDANASLLEGGEKKPSEKQGELLA